MIGRGVLLNSAHIFENSNKTYEKFPRKIISKSLFVKLGRGGMKFFAIILKKVLIFIF